MSAMNREIGGYFGLERFSGKEYYEDLIGVNSARNALLYIMKVRGVKKLYIPAFLCDTVARLCEREGYPYEEYPIDRSFLPVFDRRLGPDEYLYVVNYYGQISNEQILQFKSRWKRVIFDNVQAFYQKPAPGIDTVYSCRKFFGVPDGGYVAVNAHLEEELPLDCSGTRMKHVLGRFEENGSAYYRDFQVNDEGFYSMPLRGMSSLTRNILRAIDYNAARLARNANYAQLDQFLGQYNALKFSVPDGPYAYPFYCRDGLAVRKRLAEQKVYIPTLWPNVLSSEAASLMERDYAANILPLPCDQRYGIADMEYVISALSECL